MISQRCPRCNSDRVRRGYRHTPWLSRLICRYYLLCDNCNWEFVGFALPGTTSAKPTRRPKRRSDSSDESGGDAETSARDQAEKEETTSSEEPSPRRSDAAMMF